MNKLTVVCKFR